MQLFSPNNTFRPFYFVEKPLKGRRLAIGDIHGHYYTLLELLNKVKLTKNDQLFLLGDMIDRGQHCQKVLDYIIELLEAGYQVFPLRGNHEDMCWQAHKKNYSDEELKIPRFKWGRRIIDNSLKIFPEYVELLKKLPYYYKLDNYYLVHAGFNFSISKPFTDYKTMLWSCNIEEEIQHFQGKTIIHGHSKRALNSIKEAVKGKKQLIGLDNSVYNTKSLEYGNLVCLDIDSKELFVQKRFEKA